MSGSCVGGKGAGSGRAAHPGSTACPTGCAAWSDLFAVSPAAGWRSQASGGLTCLLLPAPCAPLQRASPSAACRTPLPLLPTASLLFLPRRSALVFEPKIQAYVPCGKEWIKKKVGHTGGAWGWLASGGGGACAPCCPAAREWIKKEAGRGGPAAAALHWADSGCRFGAAALVAAALLALPCSAAPAPPHPPTHARRSRTCGGSRRAGERSPRSLCLRCRLPAATPAPASQPA